MKRFIICFSILLLIFLSQKDNIIIPDEAIRIRIIANSNDEYDQKIKKKVKDSVEDELYYLLKDTLDIEDARALIKDDLSNLDSNVNNILKLNKYEKLYNINFGYNYFPLKEYKGITYKEGMYESLVVTLGEGKGDNWWCVMFPPFCLIEAHDNNTSDIEYRSFIKELINKYF